MKMRTSRGYPNSISLQFGLNYICRVLRSFNYKDLIPHSPLSTSKERVGREWGSREDRLWRSSQIFYPIMTGTARIVDP